VIEDPEIAMLILKSPRYETNCGNFYLGWRYQHRFY
jgi:hypothetical protein